MNINQMVTDQKDKLASSGKPLNAGAGPDLVEVLAARKLLEEKKAAARDLAMKQQQTPGTIAEQQEQQLLGLTQKEVAHQTGGIMQQRAQQQQKRPPQQGGIMGAMGGGKPPMPQGARPPMPQGARPPMGGAPRPPMAGGIANAPRPPMRRAGGGIVKYEVGGEVSTVLEDAKQAVAALGGTTDTSNPEYQASLQNILNTLTTQSTEEEKTAVRALLENYGMRKPEFKDPVRRNPEVRAKKPYDFTPKNVGKNMVTDALDANDSGYTTKLKELMKQDPKKAADEERLVGRFETEQRKEGLQKLLDKDLEESKRLARDKQARYKRDIAGVYAAELGAKGREFQRRTLEEQQSEQNLIRQELSNYKDVTNAELKMMAEVDRKAAEVFKDVTTSVNNAMTLFSSAKQADVTAAYNDAKLNMDQLTAEANAELKREANMTLAEANKLVAETNNIEALGRLLDTVEKIQTDRLAVIAGDYTMNAEEKAEKQIKVNAELAAQYLPLSLAIGEKLKQLTGVKTNISSGSDKGSGGSGDDDMSDEEAALVNQYK